MINEAVSNDAIPCQSQSTQTEWSWIRDLRALGRPISVPLENDGEQDRSTTPPQNEPATTREGSKPSQTEEETENKKKEIIEDFQSPSNHERLDLKTSSVLEIHQKIENYASDSDTDSSSIESEDDYESYFPSVGPPQMLQYLKESNAELSKTLPADNSMTNNEKGLHKSFFSGPCQFCGQDILPIPTVKELEHFPGGQLYCCYQYEEFMKMYISYADKKTSIKDEVIDIKPHAPYGTKAARRAAKERAAEKMREKEIERQKAITAQANFFSFARQVKTVQYALSSIKCLEEGWTLRPKTPLKEDLLKEEDNFSIEVNSTLLQRKNELYQKFYENGKPFLVIYPDGTGCCFYPSGNVAVLIVASDKGKYTYILQKDSEDFDTDDTGILSIFEPNGNACCYFKDGSLRLLLTPFSGIQIDKFGNYKKKWQWYFIKGHVHTPPFQPVCFSLNKELSCRVMEQSNIIITFTSGQRAVRFNVGAKLKALRSTVPPLTKSDENEQFIYSMQKKVQAIVEKIKLTMRFPKSPKLEVLVSNSQKSPKNRLGKDKIQLPKLSGKDPSVVVN